MTQAVVAKAEVRYKKTSGVSVIELEIMAPPGLENLTHKQLVSMLHGEQCLLTLAPEALKDQASGVIEA